MFGRLATRGARFKQVDREARTAAASHEERVSGENRLLVYIVTHMSHCVTRRFDDRDLELSNVNDVPISNFFRHPFSPVTSSSKNFQASNDFSDLLISPGVVPLREIEYTRLNVSLQMGILDVEAIGIRMEVIGHSSGKV